MEEIKKIMIKEMEEAIKALSKRYNLNVSEALNYAREEEIKLKPGRGRPKVEKREKGVRGRPRMEDKSRTSNVGEDLIGRLIAKAKKENM
jgi:hypothetical protein